jgi:hypothetical protein
MFANIYVLKPQGIAEIVTLLAAFSSERLAEYEQLQAEIEALKIKKSRLDTQGQKAQNT